MPHIEGLAKGHELMSAERRLGKPLPHQVTKCPRCESPDTKFCYFNNYSTTQPRFFCKNCKRYWTHGGALRNVPVGGGLRKNKKSKQKANTSTSSSSSSSTHHHKPSTSSPSTNVDDHTTHSLPNPPGYPPSPPNRNYLFNPRIYEAGDHATHALSYHHLSYKNMPQLYPGYNYPPPLSMEGLQQGGLGAAYTLLDPSRSQSNNGEASEISAESRSEAMKAAQFAPPPVVGFNIERSSYGLQASDHTTREGFHASVVAREDHQRPKDDNNNNNNSDGNNNYSNIMQSLGYGDELHQAKWRGRAIPSMADGVLNFDSEEGLANAVNVHDWQQISEGLCGGAGDFFYMPTQYPVTWSDLDAGTSF